MASCFLAIETATNRVAGYYTLAATSVHANDLPADVVKRLPRYPLLPAALVGRLAVDQHFRRKGLGSALLADAALRVPRAIRRPSRSLWRRRTTNAVAFYQRHGFQRFASKPTSLFLPLGTAKKEAAK
jgi:GNAT superfamily N-acetyltransferase